MAFVSLSVRPVQVTSKYQESFMLLLPGKDVKELSVCWWRKLRNPLEEVEEGRTGSSLGTGHRNGYRSDVCWWWVSSTSISVSKSPFPIKTCDLSLFHHVLLIFSLLFLSALLRSSLWAEEGIVSDSYCYLHVISLPPSNITSPFTLFFLTVHTARPNRQVSMACVSPWLKPASGWMLHCQCCSLAGPRTQELFLEENFKCSVLKCQQTGYFHLCCVLNRTQASKASAQAAFQCWCCLCICPSGSLVCVGASCCQWVPADLLEHFTIRLLMSYWAMLINGVLHLLELK